MLSSSALDALKEFYAERDAREERFAKLKAQAEEQFDAASAGAAAGGGPVQPLSMDVFAEDWNKSQFWVCLFFFSSVYWG